MKQLSIYILVVLVLLGGFAFYNSYQKQQPKTPTYKQIELDGFQSEIPSNWSLVINGDTVVTPEKAQGDGLYIPAEATYSFGVNEVSYGDTSWDQVDIYIIQPGEGKKFVPSDHHDPNTGTWSTEDINGYQAKVFTLNLDEGEVTKGGTGGKYYYFAKDEGNDFIVIHKQALSGSEFEEGFKHFIESATFSP